MTLKAGESLQNSKYVVQAVLNQSDFGVTYDARHRLLDQPVLLQTFNDAMRQRSDFAHLRQRFLAGARSISQPSISQPSATPRVLDCFEENAMPYVVLQAIPGQTPHLSDWLTLLPETLTPEALPQPDRPEAQQPEAQKPEAQKPEAQKPEAPDVSTPKALGEESSILTPSVPIAPELMHEVGLPHINGTAKNGASLQMGQSRRRISMPLLVTMLVGLGLGAGAGFALRFQPVGGGGHSPGLFGREQTFPAQGDWPITEIPNRFSSEPKVEAPLYRTNPVPTYSPIPQPLYTPKADFNSPLPTLSPESPQTRSDRPLENPTSPKPSNDLPSPPPRRQAIDSAPIPPLRHDVDLAPNLQPSAAPAPANLAPVNSAPIAPGAAPGVAPERSPKLLKPLSLSRSQSSTSPF